MSSDTKFFSVVAGLALGAVIAVALYSSHVKNNPSTTVDTKAGQKIGSATAAVKIVEFGDFQCPACKSAEEGLRQLRTNRPNDVQLIFRQFPLTIHANAVPAAQASEAAASQGKFWEFHDWLYDTQDVWSVQTNPESTFVNYAKKIGFDEKKFRDDYNSDAVKKIIQSDQDYGNSINVNQTPTFYVNSKQVIGVQSYDAWQKLIADAKK